MVSERQKAARKRYKEAHPELFPKTEPTPPKDPNKKKNKKSKFKRKKTDKNDPNKLKKLSHKKHPFRVPGMKPGESCYICKAPDHIAKDCPTKSEWEKNKVWFLLILNLSFNSLGLVKLKSRNYFSVLFLVFNISTVLYCPISASEEKSKI